MIVAFKHQLHDDDLAGRIIELATGSPWVHAELIFPDLGVSVSSWVHTDGVAFRPTRIVKPQYWELYALGDIDPRPVLQFLHGQIGTKYDWQGVWLSHVLPLGKQRWDRWTCSELVYYALAYFADIGLPRLSVMVSPGQLRGLLIQAGFQSVPLQLVTI